MSRDDFDFDDDLFGDEDELRGGFDDDDSDISFDDDFSDDSDLEIGDFDDLDEIDEDFLMEEGGGGSGPNRTFVMLAGAMIVMFVFGLIAVVILATRDTGPTAIEITRQFIETDNARQAAFLVQTQTQAPLDAAASETAQALLNAEATATAEFNQTQQAFLIQTQTQAPLDQAATATQFVLDATATAQAEIFANATASAEALSPAQTDEPGDVSSPTPPSGQQFTGSDVALTATALAAILQTPAQVGPEATPTREVGGVFIPGTTGGTGVSMPDTGLFDDVNSERGMGIALLAAAGLLGIIFGARRLRSMNNNSTK